MQTRTGVQTIKNLTNLAMSFKVKDFLHMTMMMMVMTE